MTKTKIHIKSILGNVLFEHEAEENTLRKTLESAVLSGADLRNAVLSGADLSGADLSGADLSNAVLRGADLSGADLSNAVLRGADLSGADLSGADLRNAVLSGADLRNAVLSGAVLSGADLRNAIKKIEELPQQFVNICSRDMLFIFQHLKEELPFLREQLINGNVDGTQYEGKCACLIGTAANAKKNGNRIETICKQIPYYDKGTHNMGETWFLSIHVGDTPKSSIFAKHAVDLIDEILKAK